MKHLLQIAAVVDKPEQLAHLVEDMATHRYDAGYSRQPVPANWKVLETSSTEVYADCILTIMDGQEQIAASLTTPFLFTCIRANQERYKMEWSVSLS